MLLMDHDPGAAPAILGEDLENPFSTNAPWRTVLTVAAKV